MSDSSYAEYVAYDLLQQIGGVTYKKMFGGFGVYCDGVMFALIAYDELYFKVTDDNKAAYIDQQLEPFAYEGKGKKISMSYYKPPTEVLENQEAIAPWAEAALCAAKKAKQS